MSTIWFDVDDCLTDTAPVIAQSMRRLTGIEMEPADWSHLNLLELYQLGPKDMDRVRDFWRKDELLERVEIFPHAKETLLVLHEAGYKIGLITARGWRTNNPQLGILPSFADRTSHLNHNRSIEIRVLKKDKNERGGFRGRFSGQCPLRR